MEKQLTDRDVAAGGRSGPAQTLKRDFSFGSVFALAFAFISPIIALYAIFALALGAGGPSFWWGFLLVLGGQLLVALVLAELVSLWPFAGSTYQWARQLLGGTYGWFAGWTYIWTLVILMAATAYAAAPFLSTLLGLQEPGNTTLILLSLAILAVATLANSVGRVVLKVFVALSITAEILGSLVMGTILLLFYRENSLSVIFEGFGAGEGSYLAGPFLAAAALIGWAFIGFESAGSVAEEVRDPQRKVPWAMLLSLVLVASVVMYTALALILAIPDLDGAVSGSGGDPILDTLAAKLGGGITTPLFAIILTGFIAGIVAIQASVSRTVFGFARDGTIPAARFFRQLSKKERLPINAIYAPAIAAATLLLMSGSDLYATLISMATAGFYISFAFPVVAALSVRLRGNWRRGRFTLGRFGMAVNLAAAGWLAFETVNIAWPRTPDLPWYQNYGVVVMIVALGTLGALSYLLLRERIATAPHAREGVSAGPDARERDALAKANPPQPSGEAGVLGTGN